MTDYQLKEGEKLKRQIDRLKGIIEALKKDGKNITIVVGEARSSDHSVHVKGCSLHFHEAICLQHEFGTEDKDRHPGMTNNMMDFRAGVRGYFQSMLDEVLAQFKDL